MYLVNKIKLLINYTNVKYKYVYIFTLPSSSLISKLTSKIKISVEPFLLCISNVMLEFNSGDVKFKVDFVSF